MPDPQEFAFSGSQPSPSRSMRPDQTYQHHPPPNRWRARRDISSQARREVRPKPMIVSRNSSSPCPEPQRRFKASPRPCPRSLLEQPNKGARAFSNPSQIISSYRSRPFLQFDLHLLSSLRKLACPGDTIDPSTRSCFTIILRERPRSDILRTVVVLRNLAADCHPATKIRQRRE